MKELFKFYRKVRFLEGTSFYSFFEYCYQRLLPYKIIDGFKDKSITFITFYLSDGEITFSQVGDHFAYELKEGK